MKLFTKEINQKLYNQYLKGSDLKSQYVVAKIFNPYGNGRWYLLNSDPNDPEYLWAIVQMGDIVEVGSVSRKTLEDARITQFRLPLERDLRFRKVNALELYNGLRQGKFYKKGGWVEGSHSGNAEMLHSNAKAISHHAEELNKTSKGKDIEAWVVAKSERAATDLSDITHYLDGKKMEDGGMMANGGEVSNFDKAKGFASGLWTPPSKGAYKDGVIMKPTKNLQTLGAKLVIVIDANRKYTWKLVKNEKILAIKSGFNSQKEAIDDYLSSDFEYGGMMERGGQVDKMQLNIGYNYAVDRNVDASGTFEKFKEDFKKKVPKSANFSEKVMKAIYYTLQQGKMEEGGYLDSGGMMDGGVGNWIGSYKKPIKISDVSEFLNSTKNDGHEYSLTNKGVGVTFAYNGRLYANNGQRRPNGTVIDLDKTINFWKTNNTDTLLVEDEGLVILPEKQDKYNCYTTGYDGLKNKYGNEDNITLEEAVEFCWYYDDVRRKYPTKEELEKEIKSTPYGKNNVIASTGNIFGVVVYKLSNMGYANGGYLAGGGMIKKGDYFLVLKGMEGIKRFRVRDVKANDVTTQYTKNDGTIVTNHNEKKDNLEWLLENGYIKKVMQKEYWERENDNYSKGGKVGFADKVKAIKASLLKRKKVSPKVQKDYGKTYSPKEAESSAKRIVGAMTAGERLKTLMKKRKK